MTAKKRLLCYNMFPRCYHNIAAMTHDIGRIAQMGFNTVHLNPLNVSGKKIKEGSDKFGSLYATLDYTQIHPAFSMGQAGDTDQSARAKDAAALKALAAEAHGHGMRVIGDLVLNHCARDSALVAGTDEHFITLGIDTSRWFKRYADGRLATEGLDEHVNSVPGRNYVWDDVAAFDYSDPKIAHEIVQHLWKPLITRMMNEQDFDGARLDAAALVPKDVVKEICDHIRSCSKGHEPIILAETLGGEVSHHLGLGKDSGITHVTNSSFWTPKQNGPGMDYLAKHRPQHYQHGDTCRSFWEEGNNWFCEQTGQLATITGQRGGTIGLTGSWDQVNYARDMLKNGISPNSPAFTQSMREHMANTALLSDAGWMVSHGDEFCDTSVKSVFDNPGETPQLHADLSGFVAKVNAVLGALPTIEAGTARRLFLPHRSDVAVFARPQAHGQGCDIVAVNLVEKPLTLSAGEQRHLRKQTQQLTGTQASISLHKVGDIHFEPLLEPPAPRGARSRELAGIAR